MRLSHRPTQIRDLEACFPLIRDRFLYDSKTRKELLSLWRHLVKTAACLSTVIEDLDRPKGKGQVGFGFGFFAKDSFAQQVKAGFAPYVPLRALEKWRRRTRFFLNQEEIRKANSGEGLTDIVLHYGWDERHYGQEDSAKVFLRLPEAYFSSHAGFYFRELLQEVYGAKEMHLLESGGFRVYRDNAGYRHSPELENQDPYLMGASLKSLGTWHGHAMMGMLFNRPSKPRFYFTLKEQEVFQQAMVDSTDAEIAGLLRLSPWTIKKRWQGIYEKVESMDPEILNGLSPGRVDQRGMKQRRRHLLNYLRSHPEELRPFLKLSRPRAKKGNPKG